MKSRARANVSVLRQPRLRALAAARFVSVLGSAFGPIALTFGVLAMRGGGAGALSLVLFAQALPQLLFVVVGGVLGDRVRSRFRLITVTESCAAVLYVAQAWLFAVEGPVAAVAAVAACGGMTRALFNPALEGVVLDVVDEGTDMQTANAALKVSVNTARLLGMLLAGITVGTLGATFALLLDGVSFAACAAVFAILARRVPARQVRYRGGALRAVREGWGEFVRHEWLWVTTGQLALVLAGVNAVAGLLGPLLATRYLGGAWAWSMLLVAQTVGGIAGAGWAAGFRPRRPMLASTAATASAALVPALLALHAPLLVVMCGAAVYGVAWDVTLVLWRTCLQRAVPQDAIARVTSIDLLGCLALSPLALAVVGPLATAFGARRVTLACALGIVAVVALSLLSRDIRTLPGDPPASAAEGCASRDRTGAPPVSAAAAK